MYAAGDAHICAEGQAVKDRAHLRTRRDHEHRDLVAEGIPDVLNASEVIGALDQDDAMVSLLVALPTLTLFFFFWSFDPVFPTTFNILSMCP